MAMLWLVTRLLARGGDDTNSFPNPLPAEQFVLANLRSPEGIDLATNHTNSSAMTNRTISGKFLEWLLTKQIEVVSHSGLRLQNALIDGPVDLSNANVPAQVWLGCCHFNNPVNLSGAHFSHDLSFEGCQFDGELHASGLRVDGSLAFKTYDLNLEWETRASQTPPAEADFGGYLATNQTIQAWSPEHGEFILDTNQLSRSWLVKDSRSVNVTNRWTNSFNATSWGDDLFLMQRYDDIPAQAADSVMNLTVGPLTGRWKLMPNTGALDLDSVRAQLAPALGTDPEFVREQVLTTAASNSTVAIRWLFENPTNPSALPLVAKWVRGSPMVRFYQPAIFRKQVSLDRATIAGKLDAWEVDFRGELYAHSLKVGDDSVMGYARFNGAANFIYAQIGHDFQLRNSTFQYFDASGMTVGGSLIIDEARFRNIARFKEVTVGIAFRGQYVRFENRGAPADFSGLKVDGLVDFQRAQFAGPANFILAKIKGNFQAQGATFEDNHPFQKLQILTGDSFTFNTDFGSMAVDGFAIFENVIFARSVSFRNARFGNLYLDGTRWPAASILMTYTNDPGTNDLLRLEGMDFQTIRDVSSGHFLHTQAQLEESQKNLLTMFAQRSPYSFDIYAKLENYFQREGAPVLADQVYVNAKEREGKEATSYPAKLANAFLRWTVGYGRNPLLAFGESFVFILVWGLLCQRCMVKKTPHRGAPGFGLALFFSLNTFLPIIDLGAGDLLEYRHGKEWFHYLIALEKILGYILVPLWTMALTGLIK